MGGRRLGSPSAERSGPPPQRVGPALPGEGCWGSGSGAAEVRNGWGPWLDTASFLPKTPPKARNNIKDQENTGVQEVYYEKAACMGDTFHGELMVQDIRQSPGSARSVVKSRLALFNQNNERVFSVALLTAHIGLKNEQDTANADASKFSAPNSREFLTSLMSDQKTLDAAPALEVGQLILHQNVGALEDVQAHSLRSVVQSNPWSESQRARSEFPLQVSLGMSLTEQELGSNVHEILEYAAPVHRSDSRENLGVISYVLEVESLNEHFEMVRVKTLALRGIAPAQALVKVDLPKSLFDLGPQKPSEYDKICQQYAADLKGRIAWQAVRKLIRRKA